MLTLSVKSQFVPHSILHSAFINYYGILNAFSHQRQMLSDDLLLKNIRSAE